MILRSYAKLNLFLEVVSQRKDSYHNLRTIFERIDLFDTIVLRLRKDNCITVTCNNPEVPVDSTNLCLRSAQLLKDSFGLKRGVDIRIVKRIPVGAGLGGGSSNAASVLLGLNKLWKLKASRQKLVNLAGKIGSDVPFFVYEMPFALGEARGDKITPLSNLKGLNIWQVLVVPRILVSTPLIFGAWDRAFLGKKQPVKELTNVATSVKIFTLARSKISAFSQDNLLRNDLQQVTVSLYPEVERVRQKLAYHGTGAILMSGSGPAVFGICPSRKEAVALAKRMRRPKSSWRVFVVKTH